MARLPEVTQLVAPDVPLTPGAGPVPMRGHVTSSYHSPAFGRPFALALVADGRATIGEPTVDAGAGAGGGAGPVALRTPAPWHI